MPTDTEHCANVAILAAGATPETIRAYGDVVRLAYAGTPDSERLGICTALLTVLDFAAIAREEADAEQREMDAQLAAIVQQLRDGKPAAEAISETPAK